MLEKIAGKLTDGMIEAGSVPADDKEIYVYGWSLLISQVAISILMLLMGAMAGEFLGSLVFMVFFIALRIFAGGYHASSYGSCFILSLSFYVVALIAHKLIGVEFVTPAILISLAVSVLITFLFAPVDHPNKRQTEEKKRRFRRISRLTVTVMLGIILCLLLLYPQSKSLLLWATFGMTTTSLSLMYVVINPYRERGGDV